MRKRQIAVGAVIAFSVVVMLFVKGIFMENKEEKELLSYMEQKYGEPFTVTEPYAGQFGKEYTACLLKSKTHPEETILVRKRVDEDGEYIEDNYTAILLKQELEEKVAGLAEEFLGMCHVTYQVPMQVFPARFAPGMDADSFLKDPAANPGFLITFEGDCPEEALQLFLETCKKEGYRIRGRAEAGEERFIFSLKEDGSLLYLRKTEKDRKAKSSESPEKRKTDQSPGEVRKVGKAGGDK
ncbi:MAG: hypothetical protein IKY23_06665 [Lachnospiraceae bacterium]|nr:hypothetical protein [Lachnospiraceae bacterium]